MVFSKWLQACMHALHIPACRHNVLPIVMGARREDYERSAPHNSFLHVDDFPGGPAELATFLHRLDRDDALYQQFFLWKGTGEMINTKFFCRLCALLHSDKVGSEEKMFRQKRTTTTEHSL